MKPSSGLEKIKAIASLELGGETGIGEICKVLKYGGYWDLARKVPQVRNESLQVHTRYVVDTLAGN